MNIELSIRVALPAAVILSLTHGPLSGQGERAEREVPLWTEPTTAFTIVGPIHYVGTRGLAVYLITTPAGHILINGALPASAAHIEQSIRQLGYRPEDIRILLTGHGHLDHVGTHAHFTRLSGAQIAVMAPDVDLVRSGGKSDFHYGHLPSFRYEPLAVDRVLRDGDTVALGGVVLTARHTAGHTRGGTTWTMRVDDGGLRRYSVVFPDAASINPGYRLVKYPSYPGIADAFHRTISVLQELTPDIWLPSHTSLFDFEDRRARAATEGALAWVDPDGYRRFVAARRAEVDRWIETERASTDVSDASWRLVRFQGADGSVIKPRADASYIVDFGIDGRVSARVDCNRAVGNWKLGGWNEIQFGPLAITGTACRMHPLTDRLPRDWPQLRSYTIKGGRLVLTLADGGRYEFAAER